MSQDPIRAVICGCGGMARAWINSVRKVCGVEVVGLTDLRRESAEAFAEKFELPKTIVYDTLPKAIKKSKAQVVFDVTIPAAHYGVTMKALSMGCHVLGEKPMADTMPRARKMRQKAQETGLVYAIMQNRRYLPNIIALQDFLRGDGVGPIDEVHTDFFLGPHFGGFRDEMDFPLLIDMAIHSFDQARYLINARPVSVYCESFNPARSWYKGDASAICLFEMVDDNGKPIVYTYRGSWAAEGLPTSWQCTWRVIGKKGTALWDGDSVPKVQIVDTDPGTQQFGKVIDVPITVSPTEYQGHAGMIAESLDAIRSGHKPQTYCADNINSLAMVFACLKSAKTGKRVKVEV
ncbi:MAG: gfo/Idh/MocA family oxidoreductase [Phycisphaera sp.]|nr:gfo/Idh/MocA family oxidoreductase [Phycisphaera sp.]